MSVRTITGNLAADPEVVQAGSIQIAKLRVIENTGEYRQGKRQAHLHRLRRPLEHHGDDAHWCSTEPHPRFHRPRLRDARHRFRVQLELLPRQRLQGAVFASDAFEDALIHEPVVVVRVAPV